MASFPCAMCLVGAPLLAVAGQVFTCVGCGAHWVRKADKSWDMLSPPAPSQNLGNAVSAPRGAGEGGELERVQASGSMTAEFECNEFMHSNDLTTAIGIECDEPSCPCHQPQAPVVAHIPGTNIGGLIVEGMPCIVCQQPVADGEGAQAIPPSLPALHGKCATAAGEALKKRFEGRRAEEQKGKLS